MAEVTAECKHIVLQSVPGGEIGRAPNCHGEATSEGRQCTEEEEAHQHPGGPPI